MVMLTTIATGDEAAAVKDTERRCLVTGEAAAKEDLIRFVIDPSDHVVPDLAQKLPGRGFWVTADRDDIEKAAKKNLFARAAKKEVKVDPDLAAQVAKLYRKRCLDYLGLAKGAGIGVLGQGQVETALRAGKIALLLIAKDAAVGGVEKLPHLEMQVCRLFDRNELGAALGYDQIVYLGLNPHKLARNLKENLLILEKLEPKSGGDLALS